MGKIHILSTITLLGLLLSACTWVETTPEGKAVRVITAAQATACEEIGKTTVSLKADIAGIKRNREKVRTELETLARNSAAKLKGNAVSAMDEPENGKQTFLVYRCP